MTACPFQRYHSKNWQTSKILDFGLVYRTKNITVKIFFKLLLFNGHSERIDMRIANQFH